MSSNRTLFIVDCLAAAAAVAIGIYIVYNERKRRWFLQNEDDGEEEELRLNKNRKANLSAVQDTNDNTLDQMITRLIRMRMITSNRVAAAMRKVDRKHFTDDENPYLERAAPLGHNATISSPHIHALSLDILECVLKTGSKVLDIGSGSGFMTACMAEMVGLTGHVYGVDHIPELVESSIQNIKKVNPQLLDRITLKVGDGTKGLEDQGPFDCIYVGAAAVDIPNELVQQLKPGGRLLIPVGPPDGFHQLMQVDVSKEGLVKVKNLGSVRFVPLTSYDNQVTGSNRGGMARVTEVDSTTRFLVLPHVVPAPDSDPKEYNFVMKKEGKQES